LYEEGLGGEYLGEPLDEWQQQEIPTRFRCPSYAMAGRDWLVIDLPTARDYLKSDFRLVIWC